MDYKGCTRLDDKAGQMRRLFWIGQRRACHTLLVSLYFPGVQDTIDLGYLGHCGHYCECGLTCNKRDLRNGIICKRRKSRAP
jgi:hypothetical protein